MKSSLWFLLFWSLALYGKAPPDDALFAGGIGIAEEDTLNVRRAPNYRSPKIGYLPMDAVVGVDACREKEHSLWCKIHHISQHDYEGYGWDAPEGWVNAKYLSFGSRGYVLVDGKGDCDYVLGCKNGMCTLVAEYETDRDYKITQLKTKLISRSLLKGESRFGAMSEDGDGYCTEDHKIEDFLIRHKGAGYRDLATLPSYQRALAFIRNMNPDRPEKMSRFIHPKIGLLIDSATHFTSRAQRFFQNEIMQMVEKKEQKYLWGYAPNEEEIRMSLYSMMKAFPVQVSVWKEIQEISDMRDYICPEGNVCQAFVFYMYTKPRESDFHWQGIVIVLQQIEGRWYVVGLLRDRWEI